MGRGYNAEGDVLTQTLDGRSLNEIWSEFQQSLDLQNRSKQAIVNLLTFPVQQPIEDVPQSMNARFERASEYGEPKGIRGGDYFSLGYDFDWYDLAVRYTWKYLAEATSQQVENLNNVALSADNDLIFEKIMRTVFDNVNRTATIRQQAVNVYAFYNADGTVPPRYKNNTFDGTESHYLISEAATVDSGDLDDMSNKLAKKGYGKQNGAQQILMVNSQELAVIRTFRVATGDSADFVPVAGGAPFLLPTNTGGVAGSTPPAQYNGMAVVGQYGPWLIIEEDYIPAGYMFGFATGGALQASNPVGFREHQNASLRGLRLVKGRDNDYPLIDSFYNRGFGTGIRHRGAGVVMQVKASGSYVIPALYADAI